MTECPRLVGPDIFTTYPPGQSPTVPIAERPPERELVDGGRPREVRLITAKGWLTGRGSAPIADPGLLAHRRSAVACSAVAGISRPDAPAVTGVALRGIGTWGGNKARPEPPKPPLTRRAPAAPAALR